METRMATLYLYLLTGWSFMTLCLWGPLLDSTAVTRVHPHFSQTPDLSLSLAAWITAVFMVSLCLKTLWELRFETPGRRPAPSLPGLCVVIVVGVVVFNVGEKRPDLKAEEAGDL